MISVANDLSKFFVLIIGFFPACTNSQPSWVQRHSVCHGFGPGFFRQAELDFEPFHSLSELDAIRTKETCRRQGEACFVVRVSNGQVQIDEEKEGFQSRNRITQAHLLRVAAKLGPLPDAEFVVDTSDGYSNVEAPLFVISKFPNSAGGILYPDFSSYAWPESECQSEIPGAHTWATAAEAILDTPAWEDKADTLFWRGALTSAYRRHVLPTIAAVDGANVSFLEWVLSDGGSRQQVRNGSCIPMPEWCQHRFLANLPGNTMTLALKYRLLCGSVILTPHLWYREWYYSQLQPGQHYVEVDPRWEVLGSTLENLRMDDASAQTVAFTSRDWARRYLTDDGFDCYWRHLVELAHRHLPRSVATTSPGLPLVHAVLFERTPPRDSDARREIEACGSVFDVAIVIPACVSDVGLMAHARQTWLNVGTELPLTHRHFFILSNADSGARDIGAAAEKEQECSDVLIVDCAHGYRNLLGKMALAYRMLLRDYSIRFVIRADADSVLPLAWYFGLLPFAEVGQAVVQKTQQSPASCSPAPRWMQLTEVGGYLVCQSECATSTSCRFFAVDGRGRCSFFYSCKPGTSPQPVPPEAMDEGAIVYEYRLRTLLNGITTPTITDQQSQNHSYSDNTVPFVLGTILYGNRVFSHDTHNPQWNNHGYRQDLGLDVYPPYPEASGYAMSASVAAFLAAIGDPAMFSLARLRWRSWAIEDSSLGTILAGLDVSFLQLPSEVRYRQRVIRVNRTSRVEYGRIID